MGTLPMVENGPPTPPRLSVNAEVGGSVRGAASALQKKIGRPFAPETRR
jgi:hypothetical protein